MVRTYNVMRLPGSGWSWEDVPPASVDLNPWCAGGSLPPAEVRVALAGEAFRVRMRAWERPVRVAAHVHNGGVWEDSCIEFFLNPAPAAGRRYLNFEVNAEGVMLLGFGPDRHDRRLLDFDPARFRISADVPPGKAAEWNEPYYTLQFDIPVAFLEELYGVLELKPGTVMAGNFQKCGEKTANPHYGVWNPILTKAPDFHQPDYFGRLILE